MTNRLLAFAFCLAIVAASGGCSLHKQAANENTNHNAPSTTTASPATPTTTHPVATVAGGELQPGEASGTFTAKGEKVELKYAYAGRAVRFGTESLVILLTDKPIPSDALAEEIKSATLLEDEKLRGLEYVLDENSMWVRYHPGQYQESSRNKLKEYKVENGTVRGFDDNDGNLSEGKYARSVRFVATIGK